MIAAGYYLICAAPATPPPFSIHDPTWVAAVATAGLLIGAIVTAILASLAFRKQSAEVKLLKEQAGRDIEQRRRAQAAKIFITAGSEVPDLSNEVRAWNTSEQPIYDLAAFHGNNQELIRQPSLMPGGEHVIYAAIQDADGAMPPVWLDFRDAAGKRWRTTSRGELTERG